MSNQVEYGIRINVNGNRAAADAINQVSQANERLTGAANRVADALQGAQQSQAANTSAMDDAASASRTAAGAIGQLAEVEQRLSQAAREAAQAQSQQTGSSAGLQAAQERLTSTIGGQRAALDQVSQAQARQRREVSGLQGAQTTLGSTLAAQGSQLAGIAGGHQAVQQSLRGTNQATQQLGMSQAQLNNAMRQVPAQLTDIVTSLQGGQSPLTVFLQQGGQLRDSFGSAGAAARALGETIRGLYRPWMLAAAAAAALTLAYHAGEAEAQGYARALALTNNVAGATVSQMADVADQIGKVAGSQREAAMAITELAATAQVSMANLREFGTVAVEAQRVLGRSVADTAEEFASLGKSPLSALDKIDEKYHFITASTYEQVKALQDQGRMTEAAQVAQEAYAKGVLEQRQKVLDSLTDWERGWLRIKKAASGAVDAAIDFAMGREEGNQQKIGTLLEERGRLEERMARARRQNLSREIDSVQAMLDLNQRQIDGVRARAQAESDAAAKRKQEAERDAARKKWSADEDKYLTKAQQRDRALTKTQNEGDAAGIPQEQINQRLAAIRKQYAETNNLGIQAVEAQRALEKEQTAQSLAELESRHKRQLVTEAQFITQKRDLQLQDLQREIESVNKRGKIAGGSGDVQERAKYLAQVKVLEEERRAIIQSADNQLAESAYATAQALKEQANAWASNSAAERAALQDEVSLMGVSGEARRIANEQLKVDVELRQFLANLQKQGKTLSAAEVEGIKRQAEARKADIAAIMGQRQALAAAEELRQQNRRFAAESIADERTRAAALLEIEASVWRERIALAQEGTEAQRALKEQFDIWYANQAAKPRLDAERKLWGSIEQTAHDTFISIFDSGKSAFDRLRDTLKNGLLELLYQMTVKQWIFNIGASISGGSAIGSVAQAAGASGGSGLSSIVGMVSAAKNAYSAITTGFAGLGDAVASGVQSVMSSAGYYPSAASGLSTASGQAVTPFAQAAGTAASYLGGAAVGVYGGRLISGGYSALGGSGNTSVNVGTAIGALLGGPVGAALGGFLGGAVNRLFGRKAKEITSTTINGNFGADGGFSGTLDSAWVKKGGLFRSTKRGVDTPAIDAETAKLYTQGYDAIKASSIEFATVLGINADAIKTRTQSMSIALGKDDEANKKAVADFFIGVGNNIAVELLPSLKDFQKEGELASSTLQRLAVDYATIDTVLTSIGMRFGSVGVASLAARERLLELSGGVEAFARNAGFFQQNFLSEAERNAPVLAMVTEKMSELGYAGVVTRDQFKSLVLGLDLTNDKGVKTYAELMKIAEAFAQVYPAANDAAAAVDKLKEELQQQKEQASRLLGDVDQAFNVLQAAVGREKALIQDRIAIQQESISKHKALSSALRSALESATAPGQALESRQEAQAQIKAALAIAKAGGPLPDADKLRNALSVVGQDASALYATQKDYLRDYYRTQGDIAALADATDATLTIEERSLKALEDESKKLDSMLQAAQQQIDALKGIDTSVLSVAQALTALGQAVQGAMANPVVNATSGIAAAYQASLGRAPDAAGLKYWQEQAESGTSVTDIASAIANSPEAKLKKLYKSTLGREADAAGLQFWLKAASSGMSYADIEKELANSSEGKAKRIPAFVNGGSHDGGIRMVGEDSVELEATGPSRIHSTRSLIDALRNPPEANAALVAEVTALRGEVARLREAAERSANSNERSEGHVEQLAGQFDNVTEGGNAFRAEVINIVQVKETA
ncbi:hypothetical protein B0920_02035 [Massilia sp. KIM]|uniref:phage tail length tape measure family protein n=1 Tax=Massilia sp. KIM TaxID=1955422 RepID=UPI00098FD500|nr:phage tail length tape measure family protein [Massilia sp. KIM]OON62280.1 hypothetical protein B0920_02035 [Massilia sp. KIM]